MTSIKNGWKKIRRRLDVENGDALNDARSITYRPRLGSSTLRMQPAPDRFRLIRELPFRSNTEAVTIV